MQPPSNSFLRPDQLKSEKKYPLELYICQSCFLVQLIDVVSAASIFDDYVYLSSSSKALKQHYADLAQILSKKYKLKKGDLVVDIGCNDGILLHGYTVPEIIRLGVEPSKVAEIARSSGLEVVKDFFTETTAKKIVKKHGNAKIITATNVFAHVDDIGSFVEGLPTLLADDGVFVIEAPYLLDMVDQTLFDIIYHEHLCYLSLTPLVPFLARYNLEVFDVVRIPFGASGPAIRIFISKKGARLVKNKVETILEYEKTWGVKKISRYTEFAKRVALVKKEVLKKIKTLRASGARLGGYSAPAKGNTLLNYFAITSETLECIAETNPLKQGLLTPGSHIPIVSEEAFLETMPEYALLLSWNYVDFFLEKSEYVRKGGKFLVPIPAPVIVP